MVHLVLSKQTYRAKDIAEIVFEHVYKLHGVPAIIVSEAIRYSPAPSGTSCTS